MNNLEYAELFLAESREHIAAVNRALLELEAAGGGPGAASAIGAVFRSVHTVKGMSAMMGYALVSELAHELENVLDRARRGTVAVDAGVTEALFRAADTLEQAIEAAVAGREEAVSAAGILERLRALAGPAAPAGPRTWVVPAPVGEGTLVRVRLAADTPLRGVRAFLIVQALGRIGDVRAVEPPLEVLQGEWLDLDFAMRVATTRAPAELEQVIRGAGDVDRVHIGEDAPDPPRAARRASGPARRLTPRDVVAISEARSDARAELGGDGARARHVRIDVRRLDHLMNLVGELVVARGRLGQLAEASRDPALEETVNVSSRLITELRDEITASRMVPVSHVFDRFPRVVRDAARAVGKHVEFVIEGSDIELDRSMLDEIADSLVHLLRNAVDHGIEAPDARVAAGKPSAGRLVLSAARDRSAVVIKVSDDGRGIDRARVLAKARANGLVDAAKTELTEDELLRLIARPGFSTAERVTDLSGRGVGVDAVYTRVRALGGAMDIRSAQGQGTTMLLRLPLTLAIMRAVLARVADEVYAIPLAHVSETIELEPGTVATVKGREVLLVRDEVLPLLRFRDLVGLAPYRAPNAIALEHVVVLDVGDRRAGLVIDELTGQEDIVVKQYDAVRDGLPFFGGATLLGDGSPSLIVDVTSLL